MDLRVPGHPGLYCESVSKTGTPNSQSHTRDMYRAGKAEQIKDDSVLPVRHQQEITESLSGAQWTLAVQGCSRPNCGLRADDRAMLTL